MHTVHTLTMNPTIDVSTTIDQMTPVHKLRCATAQRDPGGGGINVARVLLRLGGDVTAIFPVGGATGQVLHRLVEAEGIDNRTINLSDETRLCFTVLEKETGDEFRFVLPGPMLSEPEWRECLNSLPDQSNFIVMSGSLPPGVPDSFYANIARRAKARGAKVILDTSGPALKVALHEGLHLIKPNLRELGELTNSSLENQDDWILACRELIGKSQAEIVTLTLGDKGALLVTKSIALRALALPIQPVSTVGAGDSFLGGLVWALADGADIKNAFRYGVAAGSAALLTPGTELCLRKDVERLYPDVRLLDVS